MRNLFVRPGGRARSKLPRVTIAQRVIDKIVANALNYPTETGESLVGLAVPTPNGGEPDLYVLETIPPDETAIRLSAYFEQGDDLQGDIFNWYHDNWELIRRGKHGLFGLGGGAMYDAPLTHLGDWHKHPGTYYEPSMGDLDTAREAISDPNDATPQLLVMLATVWDNGAVDAISALRNEESEPAEPAETTAAAQGNDAALENAPEGAPPKGIAPADAELDDLADVAGLAEAMDDLKDAEPVDDVQPIRIPVDAHTVIRIDCWYISRRLRRFRHLTPQVVPDSELPALPVVGWHLRMPDRLRAEVDALTRAGYAISLEELDADHKAPLECCLSLARLESHYILIAVTAADYPQQRPTLRRAPMSAMKDLGDDEHFWDRLWRVSEPVPESLYPAWAWTPERQIIDLAREIEPRLTEGK
ncbi:MAG: hypothetical protein IT323_22175 [Anaerolineae bacterium]|nr:hypothetical protein [Anaerolineae bacterium]